MKRSLLFALAVALLASCSHNEIDVQTPVQDDMVFYASFEQPSAPETKVYANEDLHLRWNADDRVSIFNKLNYNQEYRFTGETGANAGGFKKVDNGDFESGAAIPHIVSVYPYQESTSVTDGEAIRLTLPAEQKYVRNTFGLGANTMVSVSEDNMLQFKNVGGYLMLKLYGEGVSVSSVSLKGDNGEKLAGKATVTMPLNGVPTLEMASEVTSEITLICETPVQLGATAEEFTQFWFVIPPVTFSKGLTITVSTPDGATFAKSTTKSISIVRSHLTMIAPLEVVPEKHVPMPEAVDLGLPSGIKWSSFNLGAASSDGYGDYYSWGETEPKNDYSWNTYLWCNGTEKSLTKYNSDRSYGTVDSKSVLDEEDDVAHTLLGGYWRMPTQEELSELLSYCDWKKGSIGDVTGFFATSTVPGYEGRSIFLPACGMYVNSVLGDDGSYGYYWSSTVCPNSSASVTTKPNCAYSLLLMHSGSTNLLSKSSRCSGLAVRPVFAEPIIYVESISLNTSAMDLLKGDSVQLTESVLPANATNKDVIWSSSDDAIATVSQSGLVTGHTLGNATITATTVNGRKTATCEVRVVNILPAQTTEEFLLMTDVAELRINNSFTGLIFSSCASPQHYGSNTRYIFEQFCWLPGILTSSTSNARTVMRNNLPTLCGHTRYYPRYSDSNKPAVWQFVRFDDKDGIYLFSPMFRKIISKDSGYDSWILSDNVEEGFDWTDYLTVNPFDSDYQTAQLSAKQGDAVKVETWYYKSINITYSPTTVIYTGNWPNNIASFLSSYPGGGPRVKQLYMVRGDNMLPGSNPNGYGSFAGVYDRLSQENKVYTVLLPYYPYTDSASQYLEIP